MLDSLAAEGCLWDRWICEEVDPTRVFKSWLPESDSSSWLSAWQERGPVELISDDKEVIDVATKSAFDSLCLVEARENREPVHEIENTKFAQLIAAAIERIDEGEPWELLWLHSNALSTRWDAPRWLVGAEEDSADAVEMESEPSDYNEHVDSDQEMHGLADLPPVFADVSPPQIALDSNSHPDLVTSWMTTYACQLRLIDDLLGVLASSIGGSDTGIVVTGTSGFSLGQNGFIGHMLGPLRSCQISVPMIVSLGGPVRIRSLTPSRSFSTALAELAKGDQLVDPVNWTIEHGDFDPYVMSAGQNARSITTQKWFYVSDVTTDSASHERLFLKPDDVNDVNDVSRLRKEVVERFQDAMRDSGTKKP